MSRAGLRHRYIREALARQITSGELAPGERLPSERALQERFGCARSVIRQALAALIRDGLVMPAYPHGNYVIGARIPWLSRLRILSAETWRVDLTRVHRTTATEQVAEALQISTGSPVIERHSELSGRSSGEGWGLGVVRYPARELTKAQAAPLLDPGEITYEHLEMAFKRRITSYHERMLARTATASEKKKLRTPAHLPVLEVRRITHTTTTPISLFRFVARSDRFEADYLLQV